MLVNDKELYARLNSPSNLISQIKNNFGSSNNSSVNEKRKSAMSLFGIGQTRKVCIPEQLLNTEKSTTESIENSKEETKEEIKVENSKETKLVANPFKRPLTAPAIFTTLSSPPSSEFLSESNNSENSELDKMLSESEAEIKLALAHNSALNLVEKAIQIMASKIDNMKPSDLPRVVAAASKVVEHIRRERLEVSRAKRDSEVHFHFYTPQQKTISDYGEIIEVESTPATG